MNSALLKTLIVLLLFHSTESFSQVDVTIEKAYQLLVERKFHQSKTLIDSLRSTTVSSSAPLNISKYYFLISAHSINDSANANAFLKKAFETNVASNGNAYTLRLDIYDASMKVNSENSQFLLNKIRKMEAAVVKESNNELSCYYYRQLARLHFGVGNYKEVQKSANESLKYCKSLLDVNTNMDLIIRSKLLVGDTASACANAKTFLMTNLESFDQSDFNYFTGLLYQTYSRETKLTNERDFANLKSRIEMSLGKSSSQYLGLLNSQRLFSIELMDFKQVVDLSEEIESQFNKFVSEQYQTQFLCEFLSNLAESYYHIGRIEDSYNVAVEGFKKCNGVNNYYAWLTTTYLVKNASNDNISTLGFFNNCINGISGNLKTIHDWEILSFVLEDKWDYIVENTNLEMAKSFRGTLDSLFLSYENAYREDPVMLADNLSGYASDYLKIGLPERFFELSYKADKFYAIYLGEQSEDRLFNLNDIAVGYKEIGNISRATKMFDSLFRENMKHKYYNNALYNIINETYLTTNYGEQLEKLNQYKQDLLKDAEDFERIEYQLAMGFCLMNMSKQKEAEKEFNEVLNFYLTDTKNSMDRIFSVYVFKLINSFNSYNVKETQVAQNKLLSIRNYFNTEIHDRFFRCLEAYSKCGLFTAGLKDYEILIEELSSVKKSNDPIIRMTKLIAGLGSIIYAYYQNPSVLEGSLKLFESMDSYFSGNGVEGIYLQIMGSIYSNNNLNLSEMYLNRFETLGQTKTIIYYQAKCNVAFYQNEYESALKYADTIQSTYNYPYRLYLNIAIKLKNGNYNGIETDMLKYFETNQYALSKNFFSMNEQDRRQFFKNYQRQNSILLSYLLRNKESINEDSFKSLYSLLIHNKALSNSSEELLEDMIVNKIDVNDSESVYQFLFGEDRLESIRSQLQDNEALVDIYRFQYQEFKIGGEIRNDSVEFYCYIITKKVNDSVKFIIEFSNEATRLNKIEFRNHHSLVTSTKVSQDSTSFYQFWAKVDNHLNGIKKVTVNPDGVYHKINPNVLFDGKLYMIDKYQTEFSSKEFRIKSDILNLEELNVLLVGNPTFSYSDEEIFQVMNSKNTAITTRQNLTPIPNSKFEVLSIKNILSKYSKDILIYTEDTATEDNVRKLKGEGIVHFATHGISQDFNGSYFNALFFEKSELNDGILTDAEIKGINLSNNQLTVLSACQTGLGEVNDGDGLYGLKRSFKISGVRNLIASLWNVDDKVTKEFMEAFYENLVLTKDFSESLSIASKEIKRKYPQPYFWGAFILEKN